MSCCFFALPFLHASEVAKYLQDGYGITLLCLELNRRIQDKDNDIALYKSAALSSEATVPFLRELPLRTSRFMSYLFNPLSLTIHLRVSIILSGGV